MNVHVLPLRSKGALLNYNPHKVADLPKGALVGGILEWGTPLHEKGVCLMVRDYTAPPKMCVHLRLYDPKVIDVGGDYIKLRGFEPAQEGEKSVGYLQEWAVLFRA